MNAVVDLTKNKAAMVELSETNPFTTKLVGGVTVWFCVYCYKESASEPELKNELYHESNCLYCRSCVIADA